MTETRDIRSLLLKAARIVLVFALVFYTSLNVELMIAYGVDNFPSVTADDGEVPPHEETDELTDLVVYQRAVGEEVWKPVEGAMATSKASEPIKIELAADAPKQQFVAVPVWNDEYPEGYKENSPLKELSSAMFVKWAVGEKPEDPQPEKNVLVFASEPGQVTTISCEVDSKVRPEKLSLAFAVNVEAPAVDTTPKIASASVFYSEKAEGSEAQPATEIALAKKDLPKNLHFQAQLTFENYETLPDADYSSAEDGLLSEWSKNEETGESAFGDLAWSIEPVEPMEIGDDEVSIDKTGKLTVNKEWLQGKPGCRFKVNCSVDGEPIFDGAVVTVGNPDAPKPEEIQGEVDPQPTLLVEATAPLLKADGGTDAGDSAADDGDAAVADVMAKVDRTYEFDAETGTMKGLKEGSDLAFSTDTREMYSSMNGGSVNIKGHGFELKDLIQDALGQAGVAFDAPIESVDLIDRNGNVAATIPYNDLGLGKSDDPSTLSIMMATESRVLVDYDDEGGEDAENADASEGAKSDELLPNTRFRPIIKQATPSEALDADNLRWIKEVRLNVENQEQKDDVAVWINYTHVPMGVDTEFVAVPTHQIRGSWNFVWYEWKKGTSRWNRMEGEEGQTLRVPTTEETVGNRYKVAIINEEPGVGESKGGTSKPVELQPLGKDEWSVVLSYNPPVAGNMAIFQAKVYQYKGDPSKLRYTWRWSNDGGSTWSKIDPKTGKDEHVIGEEYSTQSTLKLPTSAATDTSDSGPNILYYIRVDVTVIKDDLHESNVQPLTVHPGKENTDTPSGENNDDPKNNEDPKKSDSGDDNGDDNNNKKKNKEAIITPNNNHSDFDSNDQTNIVVDDDVSDVIKEQEKAANEKAAETVPGARWTQLKTMEKPGDEVRRVLDANPFAPFAVPVGLGLTVAGGLEKLLFFRRQL